MTNADQATKIARLNDAFRTTLVGGQVMLTAGVHALPELTLAEALKAVQSLNDFTGNNGPYGEPDFGSFSAEGQRFFFKNNHYAPTLTDGSEDLTDTAKTKRVLAIMLSEEQ